MGHGLAVGALLDDRYVIESVIGEGGMGVVYRARHRFTGVAVALKVLHDEFLVDPVIQQRFLAEARTASAIGHPAIVAVSDANRAPTGQLYLAMELLAGRPLRAAIGELAGEDVRRIGLELLDALAAAHARGVIHRDLKPENIFLTSRGVRLLDFGIAKDLAANTLTLRGRVLGTIEYMAPEQVLDASSVDVRADLWAVGIVLYELYAGVRPFGGATFDEKHRALLSDDPMPIESVVATTPAVVAFFARALARDRAARFASATEMAAALRALALTAKAAAGGAHTGPTLASGAGGGRATATPAPVAAGGSRRVVYALAALVLALGVAVAIVATRSSSNAAAPRDAAAAPADARVVVAVTGDGGIAVSPEMCDQICTRLGACNLALSTCRDDCIRRLMLPACMNAAGTSCQQLAACAWSYTCGSAPNGTRSCSTTLPCLTDCRMDTRCQCGCVREMKPASATLLGKVYTCWVETAGDNTRYAQNCMTFANDCWADP